MSAVVRLEPAGPAEGDGAAPPAASGDGAPPRAPEPLAWALEELVVSVREAENLVVLRTVPGGASMLAEAIDRARVAPIVGTVAGNDTVLAITRSAIAGGVIARYFRAIARDRRPPEPRAETGRVAREDRP
ncbi:hypothetical protein [Georgenia thermotolerans]|uniref:Arginine repressor n=1 Tax=Georgenia thermotolerans TaxID=527326 RepID=A0A7J5ULL7_9MICO|nr:hypothetical protein [Georgenia thermotolerans]KAE8763252.1 hypothetical protein GB883_15185 [Georgenia thermotolerans]